jgi:hypothetical protein
MDTVHRYSNIYRIFCIIHNIIIMCSERLETLKILKKSQDNRTIYLLIAGTWSHAMIQ